MLTHDEIMKAKLVRFVDGEVVNVDTETNTGQMVFAEGSVDPEFYNLLRSSAVLYQTLSYEREQLKALIDVMQSLGEDGQAIIEKFEEMLGPIEFALSIAVTGIEDYIKEPKQ